MSSAARMVVSAADAIRWLGAVDVRRSRRSYTGEPLSRGDLDALKDLALRWRPWPGARVEVLEEAPASVFVGIVGMYGGISHAPSALVFIGGEGTRAECVGHTGEALVLEAAARGLDTCWVGGLFSAHAIREHVALGERERVFAVAALGHASENVSAKERVLFGAARAKWRRPLEEIAPGHQVWPGWAQTAMAAVRIAPSAMNRQPWRFAYLNGALELTLAGVDTPRTSKHLDCGIAMLHVEVAAAASGISGTWEIAEGPVVARFRAGAP